MSTSPVGRLIASKVVYGVTCLLAAVTLVASGYAHTVVGLVSATGNGIPIPGSPTVGAMTILVMGLESRTDYAGNVLPNSLLTAMHAGNAAAVAAGQVGGQDTNTLILIHIFAGGQRAVGFSIPRDDLVTYPHATYLGITRGKIDQAYDFAYNQSLGQTYGSSMKQSERYLRANRAGQTLPISGQVNGMPLNGSDQDVNLINVPHLKHIVKSAFYPQPASGHSAPNAGGTKKKTASTPAPSTITVDAYNGSGVSGLAARHVEVLLGSTVTTVPPGLASSGGSPASTQSASTQSASTQSAGAAIIGAQTSGAGSATDSPAPASSSTASSSTAGADNGMAGGALTVSPNARYGIPCVN